jgi:hypothetical protein
MTVANGYSTNQESAIRDLARQLVERVNWPALVVTKNGASRILSGWKPEMSEGYERPFQGGYASGGVSDYSVWDYQTDELLLIVGAGLAAPNPLNRLPESLAYGWEQVPGKFAGLTLTQSFFGSIFAHQFASLWLPLKSLPPDRTGLDVWANNLAAHQANLAFSRHPQVRGAFKTFDGTNAFLTAHEDVDSRYAGHGASPNGLCYMPLTSNDLDHINCALSPKFAGATPVPDLINGVLAPYAAGSAFYYLPDDAVSVLRHYYFDLGLWEPLRGFPDAFSLSVPEFLRQEAELALETEPERVAQYQRLRQLPARVVQHVQFGIDQGPMCIALANYLHNGRVHGWVTRDTNVVRALATQFPFGLNLSRAAQGGTLNLSGTGLRAGVQFQVEVSETLTNWTAASPLLSWPGTNTTLLLATNTGNSQMFYRLRLAL